LYFTAATALCSGTLAVITHSLWQWLRYRRSDGQSALRRAGIRALTDAQIDRRRIQQPRPGGVGTAPVIARLRHDAARKIHRPQTGVAARALTREGDVAAVWRPGRAFLEIGGRQDALAGAVGLHHADVETAALLLGEGDQVAARAPGRGGVKAAATADRALARAVGPHGVEARRARTVRGEDDLIAVGAERRRGVDARIGRQARQLTAAQVHHIDVRVAAPDDREGHLRSVVREARRQHLAVELAQAFAAAGRQIVEVDAAVVPAQGHIGHFVGVRGREARRHDHLVALGQEDGVVAVLVHDGQARQLVQLGAAFRHEQDAR